MGDLAHSAVSEREYWEYRRDGLRCAGLQKSLLRLNLFDILHQVENPHRPQVLIRAHMPKNLAPHRHIARAMRCHLVLSVNHSLDSDLRKLAAALPGDLG